MALEKVRTCWTIFKDADDVDDHDDDEECHNFDFGSLTIMTTKTTIAIMAKYPVARMND